MQTFTKGQPVTLANGTHAWFKGPSARAAKYCFVDLAFNGLRPQVQQVLRSELKPGHGQQILAVALVVGPPQQIELPEGASLAYGTTAYFIHKNAQGSIEGSDLCWSRDKQTVWWEIALPNTEAVTVRVIKGDPRVAKALVTQEMESFDTEIIWS